MLQFHNMENIDNRNLSSEIKKRDETLIRVVLEVCNLWYNIKRLNVDTKERENHELLSVI